MQGDEWNMEHLMAPGLVFALLAVAFGIVVIGATVTTVRQVRLTLSVHSEGGSGPALIKQLGTPSVDSRYEYETRRS
jgi:hypothetical protein